MSRGCMGICGRYETTGCAGYTQGFKFCARCHLFIKISTVMCPCCGGFLRTKSHQWPSPTPDPLTISQKKEKKIE